MKLTEKQIPLQEQTSLNGFQGDFNILMGSFTNAPYVAELLQLTKTFLLLEIKS